MQYSLRADIREKQTETRQMLRLLERSAEQTKPYVVQVCERKFLVYPGVFSPAYFEDSQFFTAHLLRLLSPRETLLEIGPGIGALVVLAAERGVHVTAIDINPMAVENTLANLDLYNIRNNVRILKGDLFEPLSSGETFDTIYWNAPFAHVDRHNLSVLEKAIFDPGYRNLGRFVCESASRLKANGRVIVGFSSTLGHRVALQDFASRAGFSLIQLPEVGFDSDPGQLPEIRYELYEARQAQS